MGRMMGNPNEIQVVNIRMVKEPSLYSTEKITGPEDVKKVIAKELSTYDREVFAVLNLKTNGQPINLNICSVGTLDASVVSPREVFKSTILSNSAAFVAIHNHPSADIKKAIKKVARDMNEYQIAVYVYPKRPRRKCMRLFMVCMPILTSVSGEA